MVNSTFFERISSAASFICLCATEGSTELSGERSELRVYDRRKHRIVWRAQRALAHSLLFIELAGERIAATEASTKLSFLFFFLVGYSILCT